MDLIPIRFLRGEPPYNATEIAGFPLPLARHKVASGIAEWFGEKPAAVLELEAAEAVAAVAQAPAAELPTGDPTAAESEKEVDPTPLPEDFPCRKTLVAAGIETLGAVPRGMDELMAIDGIGLGFAKKILAALEG